MGLTITVHVHEKIGVIRLEKNENLTTYLVRFIVNHPLTYGTGVSLLTSTVALADARAL
jgi:hypothetical protein